MNILSSIIVLGLAICVIILLLITIKYVFPKKTESSFVMGGQSKGVFVMGSQSESVDLQPVAENIENSNKNVVFIGKSSKFATTKNTILELIHLENGNVMVIEEYLAPEEDFDLNENESRLAHTLLKEEPKVNYNPPAEFVDNSYSEEEKYIVEEAQKGLPKGMTFSDEEIDNFMNIQKDLFNGLSNNQFEVEEPVVSKSLDVHESVGSSDLNSLPNGINFDDEDDTGDSDKEEGNLF